MVRLALLGIALSLAIAASGTAWAARRRPAVNDSDRVVRKITVDERGIQIVQNDEASRVKRIEAGGHGGISITVDDSAAGERVVIDAPGVIVAAGESDIVRVFADAEVPPDQEVEGDVVAVFGSVRVEGRVLGNVVAVFGSVSLEPGASVNGDAVAVGGGLEQSPGAIVRGESVSLGFLPIRWGVPGLRAMIGVVLMGWILTVFVGWLVTLVFPTRLLRIAATASRRVAAALFLGLFSAPLLIIAMVLLFVTVIGIPIAFILPLVYVFVVWIGQLASAYMLGSRLLRRRLGEGTPFMPIVMGTLFVAVFFVLGALLAGPEGATRTLALFFSLLGALLVIGFSVVGTGAVLLSRFGSRPRDIDFENAQSPIAGPLPAATAPAETRSAGA
jgi:hypothetical protein